ncbi:hypothetical protein B7494_g7708 [Chlorociboria aeruginascens]|nr:hypothetical protein B7494_g7708 [Chlorociboria aeruginascens]
MGEPKLVWNPDNIRDVAESVGISSLNEEAVRALSQEVEYRVGQVIVEAMRFMHMGKRTVLGTQDISQALKALDVEPLYGYESTRPLRFGEASLGPGQPLFYIEDEEVDFEKLINSPLPKVPRDMSFTAHWLAVEGVQPSIPQNPTTAEARASELVPKGPGANSSLAALAGNDNVTVKPLVKHVLSKELILYFDKISNAILNPDNDSEVVALRKSAFESIRSDPGLQQLSTYATQFVAEKITHSLNNLFILRQMLELCSAMTDNVSLHMDPYATSLAPAILTCLIGRNLGSGGTDDLKEQYQLRDMAAALVGKLCKTYALSAPQLKARFAKTCLKAFFDISKTLAQQYGAINGMMAAGGPEAIRVLILRGLKTYEWLITKAQNERGPSDEGVQLIISAIVRAVMSITDNVPMMSNGTNGITNEAAQVEDYLGPIIGGRIAALGNHKLNKAILETRGL